MQGLHGIHGTQVGHEQQPDGGDGAGGLLQQLLLLPPLQHVDGHLGAHIHQTVQGEHEQPLHGVHGRQVVGASVVVVDVVVVVGSSGVTLFIIMY